VPYYSADPPPEYSLQNVQFDDTTDRSIFSPRPGNYQLWATSGSTAWLSIETYSSGALGAAGDAYRVLAGTHSIAISSDLRQSVAQFTPVARPACGSPRSRSDDDPFDWLLP
jgi:hypothetical protein